MNRSKVPAWSLACGLIVLQMILVAIIVHGESLTFDEGDHIFAGYMMWHTRRLRSESRASAAGEAGGDAASAAGEALGASAATANVQGLRRIGMAAILWSGMMAQGNGCSSACA